MKPLRSPGPTTVPSFSSQGSQISLSLPCSEPHSGSHLAQSISQESDGAWNGLCLPDILALPALASSWLFQNVPVTTHSESCMHPSASALKESLFAKRPVLYGGQLSLLSLGVNQNGKIHTTKGIASSQSPGFSESRFPAFHGSGHLP